MSFHCPKCHDDMHVEARPLRRVDTKGRSYGKMMWAVTCPDCKTVYPTFPPGAVDAKIAQRRRERRMAYLKRCGQLDLL